MSHDVPGGTSTEGTTTKVYLGGDLDQQDKKILCGALCQCKKGPNISIIGARLKQACVATKLNALDARGDSIYKPEISYNMNEYAAHQAAAFARGMEAAMQDAGDVDAPRLTISRQAFAAGLMGRVQQHLFAALGLVTREPRTTH
ncbi:hypothetical protein [Burkholderia gladioli]|uniref:hypothetical protein n=1 Tax=Burkholderia gladioli TaxID=28095 RepID=UPI003B9822FE